MTRFSFNTAESIAFVFLSLSLVYICYYEKKRKKLDHERGQILSSMHPGPSEGKFIFLHYEKGLLLVKETLHFLYYFVSHVKNEP